MEFKSLYAIAKELNASRQSLSRMIKRNPDTAPKPNEAGKYDLDDMKEFYELHTYNTGGHARGLKEGILAQEYRLKKLKADEAEGLVLPKAWVEDAIGDAHICLISVIEEIVTRCATDKKHFEELKAYSKIAFQRWQNFCREINDPKTRKKFVNPK